MRITETHLCDAIVFSLRFALSLWNPKRYRPRCRHHCTLGGRRLKGHRSRVALHILRRWSCQRTTSVPLMNTSRTQLPKERSAWEPGSWIRRPRMSGRRMSGTSGVFPDIFCTAILQKHPRAHKNKIGTPPPQTQNPPLKQGILWTWRFSCRKKMEILGVHKIGAAISGPRIADKNFTDTVFSLGNEGKDGKNPSSRTSPGSPRCPSSRHPRPPECDLY